MRSHCYPSWVVALACMVSLAVCMGCAAQSSGRKVEKQDVLIIDRPTPPGEVPPPGEPKRAEPYRPYPEDAPAETSSKSMEEAVAAFSKRYRTAGRPRIAVYVNRMLAGDVREWTSDRRVAVGYGETTRVEEGGREKTETTTGGAAVSAERRAADGAGKILEEKWAWRLEDTLLQPLMEAGARVIDRKVIMRLAAAGSGETAYGDAPVKRIEMTALKGKADLLAEVLISRLPDAQNRYVYRVRAYEVKSGQVLVTTSSATWPRSRDARGEWVATSSGYDRAAYPNAEKLGAWLAQDLMEGLIAAW